MSGKSVSVGIDLGTTNTSIAVFDGKNIDVVKQVGGAIGSGSETTPSAIFIDEHQSMFIGDKAYQQVALRPEDVARGWKRLLGSGTDIEFAAAGLIKSPEWCSTELLKRVFSFLPEPIRKDSSISVVVTVPAAFGQVMNDATLKAAADAGLPNVKLLTEPVAACLAVMQKDSSDKKFLVYDLGGGTFDVSVADFAGGSGAIIAQGGIETSGGRDWDLAIVNKIVIPWILDNYNISIDDLNSTKVKNVLAMHAELAKIELSQTFSTDPREDLSVRIRVPHGDLKVDKVRLSDDDGKEIGLDVELKKSHLDQIILALVESTVTSCKQVMKDTNIDPESVDYIVFIGGPTLYSPLRAKISQSLGIAEYTKFLDPMTAVAKGAAVYAESIDAGKGSAKRAVTSSKATKNFPLETKYESRVTTDTANLTLTLSSIDLDTVSVEVKNSTFSSGSFALNFQKEIKLTLTNEGVNEFLIEVTVPGQSEKLAKKIEIVKVSAVVNGIAVSDSLFFEVLNDEGTASVPELLIQVGETLPKKGKFSLVSAVEMTAKNPEAKITFRLYQGEIFDFIQDNTFIGELVLPATALGRLDKIKVGDELLCSYEISEGQDLKVSVSVPSIGLKYDDMYVSGAAILNPAEDWMEIAESGHRLKRGLEGYLQNNPSKELELKLVELDEAITTIETSLVEEEVKAAAEKIKEVRRQFFDLRQDNLPKRLLAKYQYTMNFFESKYDGQVKKSATNPERKTFSEHAVKAKAFAESGDEQGWDGEDDKMWDVIRGIIWRSGWWVEAELQELAEQGSPAIQAKAQQALDDLEESGRYGDAARTLSELFSESRSPKSTKQGVDVKKGKK
jgi:molecular chaperone DnaK